MINCYKILEVGNFSDDKVILRGYRAMAKRYHPDVNTSKEAGDIFVLIAKVYQTLSDVRARKIHDDQLKQALLLTSTTHDPHYF